MLEFPMRFRLELETCYSLRGWTAGNPVAGGAILKVADWFLDADTHITEPGDLIDEATAGEVQE